MHEYILNKVKPCSDIGANSDLNCGPRMRGWTINSVREIVSDNENPNTRTRYPIILRCPLE